MVDNRNAGFYGIGGSFNFKSGDASGTAAKMSQEKYGSEAMYLPPVEDDENGDYMYEQPFVDRSALLRATLNSMAMNNVASVINAMKHKKDLNTNSVISEEDEESENQEFKNNKDNDKNSNSNSSQNDKNKKDIEHLEDLFNENI